jgi:hypothetical protein
MATALLISLIVSTIGAGYFIYGKKQAEASFMLCGLLLCVFPYFITSPELQLPLGAALMYAPFLVARFF